jgi:DNA replicative helicase MCM subunit Mcm2 (Cdc46/Mcm family)
MTTTTQSESKSNTLSITPELRNVGITEVSRKGSIKSGFVVTFRINDRDLNLYMKSKRDKTQAELEKSLKKFSTNKILIGDLQMALEPFIADNFDWMYGGLDGNATSANNESDDEFTDNSQPEESNEFDRYRDLDKSDPLDHYEEVDIEKVSQLHEGKIKFTGRVKTVSQEIDKLVIESQWICRGCHSENIIPFSKIMNPPRMPKKCQLCSQADLGFDPNHQFVNARFLKIESEDIILIQNKAPISIKVYALDSDSTNTQMSSRVTIYGEIENVVDPRLKRGTSYVIAKRIIHPDNQTLQIQPEDIPKIMELSRQRDLPMALAALYAPHLKDYDFEKFLIILAAIGAPTMRNLATGEIIERGPLNILLIGLPGSGKTILAKGAVFLKPRSKFAECQYTTVATLCGTVVRDNNEYNIMPGLAASATKGILVLDELDKASKEFIMGLLEFTEHCTVTIGKNVEFLTFDAEVTTIATCNPRDESWANKRKLELSDIPLSNSVISRFDFVIPFREYVTEKEWKDFTRFILKRTSKAISIDYDLLIKYIEKTQQITEVEFDNAAIEIVVDYAAKCAMNKDLAYIRSKRVPITIQRMCGTVARSRLSEIVTADIAHEAIGYLDRIIQIINLDKENFFKVKFNPLEIIINSILELNPSIQRAIILTNHIEGICQKNKDLDAIIGMQDKPQLRFKRNKNSTLDTLCRKVTQDPKIGVSGPKKEKVYVIRKLDEESPDSELDRVDRGIVECQNGSVKIKNNDNSFQSKQSDNNYFDDATEIEKQADKELDEALNQQ